MGAFSGRAGYSGRPGVKSNSGSDGCEALNCARRRSGMWRPARPKSASEPVASLADGEVRVRAVASALSRGTERLVFSGRVPESEFERMRAPFMSGAFPYPVKYGYAMVGRVEEGPADLKGRLCFALYPHQTVFNLPAENIVAAPGRSAAGTRRARRQHGDGAQRHMGRGAGAGRPHRGGWRRGAGTSGRAALRTDAGHVRDRGRYRAVACR